MTSPAVLVHQLRDVVEQLLAVDPSVLSGDELQSLVVSVQTERSRLAVAAAEVMTGWDTAGGWRADGSLNASLALGRDTRSCHRAAKRELRRARLLGRMVRTREAVVAGRLSMDHVDLFVHYAAGARFELFLEHGPVEGVRVTVADQRPIAPRW